LLTSLTISSSLNSTSLNFTGNALTQSVVDAILAHLVTAGYTGGSVDLSGGTNSTPSSAGLISKATLQSNGWTVNNN
jgi:hypothetical protein